MYKIGGFVTVFAVVFGAPTEDIGSDRIIHGGIAQQGEIPYQALLLHCKEDICSPTCGGTIIGHNDILTAAHCCKSNYNYRVGVGHNSIGSSIRSSIGVTGFSRHAGYDDELTASPHDICIVHLKNSIKYSTKIQPAALPSVGSNPTGSAVISGWGTITDPPDFVYPKHLRKANVHIISIEECSRLATVGSNYLDMNGGNICTFDRISIGPGDSGGPLAQNGVVIGVASWGIFPSGGKPSVYTAVGHYVDWIDRHMTKGDKPEMKLVEKVISTSYDYMVKNGVNVDNWLEYIFKLGEVHKLK